MAIIGGVGVAIGILVTFLSASIYLGGTFERLNSLNIRFDGLQRRIDQIDQSGALRQVEINSARLAQLESTGSPGLATLKETLSNTLLRLTHIETQYSGLPEADATNRRDIATLQTRIMELKNSIDAINKDLRPREFWEKLAASVSTLDQQVKDLTGTRDQGVVQWGQLVSRVAASEVRIKANEDNIGFLRDRLNSHERDDMDNLRDRVKGVRIPAKEPQ